jgi:hypothetical protein
MAPPPLPITSQPAASQHAELHLSPLGMFRLKCGRVQCRSALDQWDLRDAKTHPARLDLISELTVPSARPALSLNPKHRGMAIGGWLRSK